jgi:hypothetical protein
MPTIILCRSGGTRIQTVDGNRKSEFFSGRGNSKKIYMRFGSIIQAMYLVTLISAKSWLDQVGLSGAARFAGGTYSRQVCPPNSGPFCLGSSRPCAAGIVSNPKASMFSNESLYLHWTMNNLPRDQTNNTCITVALSPYNADPDWGTFSILSECIPFTHGAGHTQTDSYLMLPSTIQAGEYTVVWMWKSTGLTYASCADVSISVLPAPNPSLNPNPLSDTRDCKQGRPDPDTYCRSKFGFKSYCRSQDNDACGNSYCYTEEVPADCNEGIFSPVLRRLEQIPDDNSKSLYRKIYDYKGCDILGSEFCSTEFGEGSSCDINDIDDCGRARCSSDDSPRECDESN